MWFFTRCLKTPTFLPTRETGICQKEKRKAIQSRPQTTDAHDSLGDSQNAVQSDKADLKKSKVGPFPLHGILQMTQLENISSRGSPSLRVTWRAWAQPSVPLTASPGPHRGVTSHLGQILSGLLPGFWGLLQAHFTFFFFFLFSSVLFCFVLFCSVFKELGEGVPCEQGPHKSQYSSLKFR